MQKKANRDNTNPENSKYRKKTKYWECKNKSKHKFEKIQNIKNTEYIKCKNTK